MLDTVENLTDGLLNSLCPPLKGVIQNYSDSMCDGGSFAVLGLCATLNGLGVGNLGLGIGGSSQGGSSQGGPGQGGSGLRGLGLGLF